MSTKARPSEATHCCFTRIQMIVVDLGDLVPCLAARFVSNRDNCQVGIKLKGLMSRNYRRTRALTLGLSGTNLPRSLLTLSFW